MTSRGTILESAHNYNPYDAGIGPFAEPFQDTNIPKPQHPITSSQLVRLSSWLKGYDDGNKIYTSLRTLDQSNSNCRRTAFWTRMGMSGLRGYRVPAPIFMPQLSDILPETSCASHKLKHSKPIEDYSSFKALWRPSISVIVPIFGVQNCSWAQETFMSLWSQKLRDFEIIVVDDGTSLGSLEIFPSILSQIPYLEHNRACNSILHTLEGKIVGGLWSLGNDHPIPFRIVRHNENQGLSSARNTGVLHARGTYIVFLDPDDKLSCDALEKMMLMGMVGIGKPVPHRRGNFYGFVHPGVRHFGSKEDIVYASSTNRKLTDENYLTSTALVLRSIYVQAGGMCPRNIVKFFEDWDFWLRLSAYGVEGSLLREPIFWYRRHNQGQSSRIFERGNGYDEVRRNNPIAFGDLSWTSAQRLLRDGYHVMPCYRKLDPYEHDYGDKHRDPDKGGYPFIRAIRDMRATYHPNLVAFDDFLHINTTSDDYSIDGTRFRIRSEKLDWPILDVPLVSRLVYNPLNTNILYIVPWTVMGGADLFDLNILESLKSTPKSFHITLVLERAVPEQAWEHLFSKFTDESFNLQILTNDTYSQDQVLDYLIKSRRIKLVVNTRTVAGYRAFERWGRKCAGSSDDTHLYCSLKLVDILHVYHLGDRSNWDWRAARVGKYMHRRIVVSNDLRKYMEDVVGSGDRVLGVPDPDAAKVSLSNVEREKFSVVYPPVDIREWLKNFPSEWQWMEKSSIKEELLDNPKRDRPTVFFVGRLDIQKNPGLWVRTCAKVLNLLTVDKGAPPSLRSTKGIVKHLETIGSLNRSAVISAISAPMRSVLLVTAGFDGVSIAGMEALAVGVPVVSLDCGGWREVSSDPEVWDTAACTKSELWDECSLSNIVAVKVVEIIQKMGNSKKEIRMRRAERWASSRRFREKYSASSFQRQTREIFTGLINGT
ncbi:hypothetical protein BJ742DRAFT_737286 [Cladochytrium replicatum]|nr:hypothetical protein BJ742DRAFT_737286 [Cladochytrium replicatum]